MRTLRPLLLTLSLLPGLFAASLISGCKPSDSGPKDCVGDECTPGDTKAETPTLNFAKSTQAVEEGQSQVSVLLRLSDEGKKSARVSYTVGGSAPADGSRHDLEAGSVTFYKGTVEAEIKFALLSPATAAGETIVITLSEPVNLKLGSKTSHTVSLPDPKVEPGQPEAGSISINGGAEYTRESEVSLALGFDPDGDDDVFMQFSCDQEEWSEAEAFATSRSFDLVSEVDAGCDDAQGIRNVYVRFRQGEGLWSPSATSAIHFDSIPPQNLSLGINGGASWTADPELNLALGASDEGSGLASVELSCDGQSWAEARDFASSLSFDLSQDGAGCSGDEGERQVFARFSDRAGNLSDVVDGSIHYAKLPVSDPAVISINAGQSYATSTEVSLALNPAASPEGLLMRLSCTGDAWLEAQDFAATLSFSLAQAGGGCDASEGLREVHVAFSYNGEEWSEASFASIFLDTKAPTVNSFKVNDGAPYLNNLLANLALEGSDNGGSGVASVLLSCNGSSWTETLDFAEEFPIDLAELSAAGCNNSQGEKTLHLSLVDQAGNISDPSSASFIYDSLPPHSPSLVINGGAAKTASPQLNLSLSAVDEGSGLALMAFSCDGNAWSDPLPFVESHSLDLSTSSLPGCSDSSGVKNVYVRFSDVAGNLSDVASAAITLDREASKNAELQINGGDGYSNSLELSLGLSPADPELPPAQMRFSCDGNVWTAWQNFATTRTFNLAAEADCNPIDGEQTVRAQFRNAQGEAGSEVSASIIVDRIAPSTTITTALNTFGWNLNPRPASFEATDATSGVDKTYYCFDEDNSCEPNTLYEGGEVTFGVHSLSNYARYYSVDKAGNKEAVKSFGPAKIDTTAPTDTSISAPDFTQNTQVTLTLSAIEDLSEVSSVRVACQSHLGTFVPYTETLSFDLEDTEAGCPAGDGERDVYATFFSSAGRSAAAVSTTVVLDRQAPSADISFSQATGSDDWYLGPMQVTVTAKDQDGLSGLSKVSYRVEGGDSQAQFQDVFPEDPHGQASVNFTVDFENSRDIVITYLAHDRAGNSSAEASTLAMKMDQSAPELLSFSLQSESPTADTLLVFDFEANDAWPGSQLGRTQYSCDGSNWVEGSAINGHSGGNAITFEQSFDLAGAAGCDSGSGLKTIYARVKDLAGNTSPAQSLQVSLDTEGPSENSISIAQGAYSNSPELDLVLSSSDELSDVVGMRFSCSGDEWGDELAYATSHSFQLTNSQTPGCEASQGERKVYAQFKDELGNWSEAVSATVIYDSEPPTDLQLLIAQGAFSNSALLDLELAASDRHSGLSTMAFSCDASNWSAPVPFAGEYSLNLEESGALGCNTNPGLQHVYARFTDRAGNTSASVKATIQFDTQAPQPNHIDIAETPYARVPQLSLFLSSTDSGSAVHQMQFSCDQSSWSAPMSYASTHTFDLSAGASLGCTTEAGSKTVYVRFSDYAGNWSTPVSASTTLDNVLPVISQFFPLGSTFQSTLVPFRFYASDEGSGLQWIRFACTDANAGVQALEETDWGPKVEYVDEVDPEFELGDGQIPSCTARIPGEFRLYAQVYDKAGNESTVRRSTDPATIDNEAPINGSIAVKEDHFITNGFAAFSTVNLLLSAEDLHTAVTGVLISCDQENWKSHNFSSALLFQLNESEAGCSANDGPRTLYARFVDGAGNVSETVSTSITLDTQPPTIHSFTVNGGPNYGGLHHHTSDPKLSLQIDAEDLGSGIAHIEFACQSSGPWSSPGSYVQSRPFHLGVEGLLGCSDTNDGTNEIYLRVSDQAGRQSTKTVRVVLDRQNPTGTSLTVSDGNPDVNDPLVKFDWNASDASPGVVKFAELSCDKASWVVPFSDPSWYRQVLFDVSDPAAGCPTSNGERTVYARFVDHAGNASTNTISTPVTLLGDRPSGYSLKLGGGSSWAGNSVVDVEVLEDAVNGNLSASYTSFSCQAGGPWTSLEPYSTLTTFDLSRADAGCTDLGDGARNIYARFQDSNGFYSATVSASIILDTEAPEILEFTLLSPLVSSNPVLELGISATDSLSGVEDMRFSCNGQDWSIPEAYATSRFFDLGAESAAGCQVDYDLSSTLFLQVSDKAGSWSAAKGVQYSYDTQGPEITRLELWGQHALTNDPLFTLRISASDNLSEVVGYRFSCDDVNFGSVEALEDADNELIFVDLANTPDTGCEGLEGDISIYVQAQDEAGNFSESESVEVHLDTTPPEALSLVINSGDEATNSIFLDLSLSASDLNGVNDMVFSCNQTHWSQEMPYSSEHQLILGMSGGGCDMGGSGVLTVYAKFMDAAGNWSEPISESIVYDVDPPTTSIVLHGSEGRQGWYIGSVEVEFLLTDAHSSVASLQACYHPTSDTCTPSSMDINSPSLILPGDSATYYVRWRSTDLVGNVQPIQTAGPFKVTSQAPYFAFPSTDGFKHPTRGPVIAAPTVLSGGGSHTCVLKNGAVACVGDDSYGAIGTYTVPAMGAYLAQVYSLDGLEQEASQISAGHDFSCALVDGRAQCWGRNNDLQLGRDQQGNTRKPEAVDGLPEGEVTALASGASHSCALVEDSVWCWGRNTFGQLGHGGTSPSAPAAQTQGLGSGVTALSAGSEHSCAIVAGELWCWGGNSTGQLGSGDRLSSDLPQPVEDLGAVLQVSAGGTHTCAIDDEGAAWCWGSNEFGQLGNGSTTDSDLPVAVTGMGSGVSAIATGSTHSCGIKDGSLYCWGRNQHGQTGAPITSSPSTTPALVGDLYPSIVEQVALGANHSCALAGGEVFCWGAAGQGQIGHGSQDNERATKLLGVNPEVDVPVVVYVGQLEGGLTGMSTHASDYAFDYQSAPYQNGECGEFGDWESAGSAGPDFTSGEFYTSGQECLRFRYTAATEAGVSASFESDAPYIPNRRFMDRQHISSNSPSSGQGLSAPGPTFVAEVWGGGGGGHELSNRGGTGGGYARATYATNPGNRYRWTIGTGGALNLSGGETSLIRERSTTPVPLLSASGGGLGGQPAGQGQLDFPSYLGLDNHVEDGFPAGSSSSGSGGNAGGPGGGAGGLAGMSGQAPGGGAGSGPSAKGGNGRIQVWWW